MILFLRARAEVHLGEASRRVAQSTSLIGHCVNRDRGYLGVPADSQSFFLRGVISCTNQTLSICPVTLSSSPPSSDPAEKRSIIQTPIPHLPLLAPHPTLPSPVSSPATSPECRLSGIIPTYGRPLGITGSRPLEGENEVYHTRVKGYSGLGSPLSPENNNERKGLLEC